jgi:hypothetical protein
MNLLDKGETQTKTTHLAQHWQDVLRLVEAREKQGFSNVAISARPVIIARDEVLGAPKTTPETPVRWVQKNRKHGRGRSGKPFPAIASSAVTHFRRAQSFGEPCHRLSAAHYREHEELIARAFKAP